MTSLHTKFRPTAFDDILGQAAVVRSLRKVVKERRAHTFIFSGPSGTGKTTLARILANEYTGGTSSTNLIEYDGASKSGAEDVRELVGNLQFRAIGASPVKFVILDECHKLSASAWTVLLKPTEEPPSHVYYAFCTTEFSKVPKAIITRCLRYDLKPVKEELILELLVKVTDAEQLDVADDVLEAIAENSDGSPRQALVYLEELLGCKDVSEARAIMRDAGQNEGIAELIRFLLGSSGHNWATAARHLKPMAALDPEACRIQINIYLAKVLMNKKTDKEAVPILRLLECFSKPYYSADKMAPLLYSVGLALGLDQ